MRAAELWDGDRLQAGKTVFQIEVAGARKTVGMPGPAAPARRTDGLPTAFPDIPGFELTKELGRGGMGVVYKAKREADGRRVAVKTILPTIAADQADLDRFVREATILAQIDHPNVVKYLATGAVEPLVYLVMEYVNGPTAHQIVKVRGPMTPVTGVKLVAQASRGLTHAHGRGFVHRDIKPANLLIGKAGDKRVVKVADFGLARAFAESRLSGLTLMDDIRGTPPFMAPDQIINYRQVTPAADQYSTAATLYWLLTAKFPHDFDTGDPCRAFAKILSEDPVPIRDRRPAPPGWRPSSTGRSSRTRVGGTRTWRTSRPNYWRTSDRRRSRLLTPAGRWPRGPTSYSKRPKVQTRTFSVPKSMMRARLPAAQVERGFSTRAVNRKVVCPRPLSQTATDGPA